MRGVRKCFNVIRLQKPPCKDPIAFGIFALPRVRGYSWSRPAARFRSHTEASQESVLSLVRSLVAHDAFSLRGQALRIPEMERILRNLGLSAVSLSSLRARPIPVFAPGTLQQPWNCPHGRPTMRHLVDTSSAKKAPRIAARRPAFSSFGQAPLRPRRPLFAGLPEARRDPTNQLGARGASTQQPAASPQMSPNAHKKVSGPVALLAYSR